MFRQTVTNYVKFAKYHSSTRGHLVQSSLGRWPLVTVMSRSYPPCLGNVGGSTQVPTCAWNKAHRGTPGLQPPEKAGKVAIWPLKCWCILKPNKTNKRLNNLPQILLYHKQDSVEHFFPLLYPGSFHHLVMYWIYGRQELFSLETGDKTTRALHVVTTLRGHHST